jgi:creatinine amidohydrolase
MDSFLMENMTVEEVRAAIKKNKTVIVPLGVVEQHGYHLPLSTDIHNAYEIAKRVSNISGAVVAPPFNYSFSGGTLPGTINISTQSMSLVVSDICHSLAEQGFKKIILLLGHGGSENLNALRDATALFLRRNSQWKDVILALITPWDFSPTWSKAFKSHDYHAAYIETSLMMYWKPELVRRNIIMDKPKVAALMRKDPDNYLSINRKVNSKFVVPFLKQRDDIKVGVMGNPNGANAKTGEKVACEAVSGIVGFIKMISKKDNKKRKKT